MTQLTNMEHEDNEEVYSTTPKIQAQYQNR